MTDIVDPKPTESTTEVKYLTQAEFDKEWARLFPMETETPTLLQTQSE